MESKKKEKNIQKENWKEKIKKPLIENIAKGVLTLGLIFKPIDAKAYYNYYNLYYPEDKKVEEVIDNSFKDEQKDLIKKIWYTRGKDVSKNAVEILTEIEMSDLNLEEEYKKVQDKKKFYVISNLLMKIAEYNTFIDTKEKERILLIVREKVLEEWKNDKYNVDLIELVLLNDKLLIDMYGTSGWWISREYEEARINGLKEIEKRKQKLEEISKSFKEHYAELNEMLRIPKKDRRSIFDYSNNKKKNKIKIMIKKFENDIFYIK
ncbi:MAG: hypothetical protein QW054_00230 [Candidatus Micrarchaeia archaeon]